MDGPNNDSDPRHNLIAEVNLLANILQKGVDFTRHIDMQSNVLIGISSAVFLFAATKIPNDLNGAFLLLGFFSALATITALMAVHPPRFMRKRGQKESLLYNKRIVAFPSAEEYRRELAHVVGSQDAILQQYATEIYNIYKYFYLPKRRLFKASRNLLFAGIFFALLAFLPNFHSFP